MIVESRGTHCGHYHSRSCPPAHPQVLLCANDHCAATTLHHEALSIHCCVAQLLESSNRLPLPTLALPARQSHPVDQVARPAHPRVASCQPMQQFPIRRAMLRQQQPHEWHIRQSHQCCLLLLTFQVRPASRLLMAVVGPRAATRCK
ncbi:unannotated protein [freshwater metagenome]|uniref:Unannotated protein n=1 Tax=freshwater metagenome TaxID=449393 RepID=A0A6J7GN78_9ZZZZ